MVITNIYLFIDICICYKIMYCIDVIILCI